MNSGDNRAINGFDCACGTGVLLAAIVMVIGVGPIRIVVTKSVRAMSPGVGSVECIGGRVISGTKSPGGTALVGVAVGIAGCPTGPTARRPRPGRSKARASRRATLAALLNNNKNRYVP